MLSERQLLILQAIVDDYIRSAEPVGSRSISKRDDVSYSAATIRNEMADLEELGFIEKPHSSAGRIPSQKGYRYYVDNLLFPDRLPKGEVEQIRELFRDRFQETEQVIQHSAKILSTVTSYISVVLGPEMYETRMKHVQIIPLSEQKAVIILVTDAGHVENYTFTIPEGLRTDDLEKVVNILNERLKGVPLYQLRQKLVNEVAAVLKSQVSNYQQLLTVLDDTLKYEKNDRVFYGGKTNLLTQPEFKDIEKVRLLYNILEEDQLVQQIFRTDTSGIQVRIGHENDEKAFENCSIITASYSFGGKDMGTIGILGPTRMEYRRVIGIIDFISKDLTKILTHLYQRG
ncbi:heat-inducible transcriptional repressor HrcA [Bacillus alkalicellulosilyticus]|uniref:heat-inducible transcriptional repressor HrcA n=1 Tax=Alkalihalobacterium alkalicellulosilyticum TaxID=1912214 RepID=UPI000996DA07|nr:heat-inducible transcriptional repressor HrcA [Bacillus alkalicellulosilyticus]